jgi:eukaryotic-like serine/threonine-protein kinase
MRARRTCAKCGVELPAEHPQELCSACSAGLPIIPTVKVNFMAALEAESQVGGQIGRYRILQQIGEGGCGTVYMAEQEEPIRRRVALKVIKPGMDTKEVVARFEAERQALALMDHAHIAKVLDAGSTAGGRPYFVMELVRGIKITDYCNQNRLSTRERLELFITVCQAIQHAHQKGVIHRDIKPSNILVTLEGTVAVPKVIDFGIAKAIQGRLTDQTLFTAFQQFLGTPTYMSPEQAEMSSLDIDTRSDIYSLGVLLYELMTGTTPFDAKELVAAGLDGMRRTIREQEPVRPSTRLSTMNEQELTSAAGLRRSEPARLIRALQGDLDWIVIRCLEKDRMRRYETANGLAMDVQRYLSHRPVVARPPSKLYRFQKLVRRNRLAFAAANAVALSILVGIGVSTWLFIQERHARQRAEKAEQIQEKLKNDAETARASEEVQRRQAVEARNNEARLRLQAEAAERTAQSEASQLGEAMMSLGKLTAAEEYIRNALAMQQKLAAGKNPEVAVSLKNLAKVLSMQNKLPESESKYREALAMERELLGEDNPTVSATAGSLAMVLQREDELEEAARYFRQALSQYRTEARDESLAPPPFLGVILHHLAEVLHRSGQLQEARSYAEESIAIYKKRPDWPINERHHAIQVLRALLTDLHDAPALAALEAESLAMEAADQRREAQGPPAPPPNASPRARGDFFAQHGYWKEAAQAMAEALEAAPQDHMLYHSVAPLLVATGDLAGYRQICQRILAQFAGTNNPLSPDYIARAALAAGSWLVPLKGDPAVADRMAKDCLILPTSGADLRLVGELADVAVKEGEKNRFLPYFHCTRGLADYRHGDYGAAISWMQKTLANERGRAGHQWDDYLYVEAYAVIAMAHHRMGAGADARSALAKAVQYGRNCLVPLESRQIGSTWRDWIVARTLLDEAEQLIGDSKKELPKSGDVETRQTAARIQ